MHALYGRGMEMLGELDEAWRGFPGEICFWRKKFFGLYFFRK